MPSDVINLIQKRRGILQFKPSVCSFTQANSHLLSNKNNKSILFTESDSTRKVSVNFAFCLYFVTFIQIKSFQFVLEVNLHHEKHGKEPKNPLNFFDTRTLHYIHLTGSTIVPL